MAKEKILLGHSEKFWKKVYDLREEGTSWYAIAKITGKDQNFYHRNKSDIEHHLTKYNRLGRQSTRGKTKIPLSTATVKIIRMAARAGLSETEIAEVLDVSMSTLQRYKSQNPDIRKIIKTGRKIATLEVVDGLQKKAAGFKIKETKLATFEGEFTDSVNIDKYFPPSEKAAELYLVNKAGWKPSSGRGDDSAQQQQKQQDTRGAILKWIAKAKEPEPGEDDDSVEEGDCPEENNIDNTEEGECQ